MVGQCLMVVQSIAQVNSSVNSRPDCFEGGRKTSWLPPTPSFSRLDRILVGFLLFLFVFLFWNSLPTTEGNAEALSGLQFMRQVWQGRINRHETASGQFSLSIVRSADGAYGGWGRAFMATANHSPLPRLAGLPRCNGPFQSPSGFYFYWSSTFPCVHKLLS